MRDGSLVAKTIGMFSKGSIIVHARALRCFETVPKQAESKQPGSKPVNAKPVYAKPAEAKPAEAKPAEAKPAGAKPAEAKQPDAKQPDVKQPNAPQPNVQQPAVKQPDAKQPQPAKASSTQVSSTKQKLIPLSGYIKARDRDGWQYELSFRHIEMEIDWPVTGGHCKVTGTAMLSSW